MGPGPTPTQLLSLPVLYV